MDSVDQIISDKAIDAAFEGTNFGSPTPREIVANSLLKCAVGYYTGHTAKCILIELGLVYKSKWALTKLGQHYLWSAYSQGVSI